MCSVGCWYEIVNFLRPITSPLQKSVWKSVKGKWVKNDYQKLRSIDKWPYLLNRQSINFYAIRYIPVANKKVRKNCRLFTVAFWIFRNKNWSVLFLITSIAFIGYQYCNLCLSWVRVRDLYTGCPVKKRFCLFTTQTVITFYLYLLLLFI